MSRNKLPQNARELAFQILKTYFRAGTFIADQLNASTVYQTFEDREKGFTRELCAGIVRRHSTLTAILEPHLKKKTVAELDPSLRVLLYLGAYQLAILDTEPYAAVSETVNVCHKYGRTKWNGLVNGVLRSVDRALTHTEIATPSVKGIPQRTRQGERQGDEQNEFVYRLAKKPLFPNPETDFAGWFSVAFSFPAWLVKRWLTEFSEDQLLSLGFTFNNPPRLSLRVNQLHTTREEMLDRLTARELSVTPAEPRCGLRTESVSLAQLPEFQEGLLTVQDEAAMQAGLLLDPQPGMQVLDLCAAPGTKTTHLAELMRNQGRIVACDVSHGKLKKISENIARLKLDIIEPTHINSEGTNIPDELFDAILVDAPCSNTGVLNKRPEARWRLQPSDFPELAQLQSRLLSQAVARLAEGGKLVYSTCSIDAEENERVVQSLLKQHPELTLQTEQTHFPNAWQDGAYQVRLVKEMDSLQDKPTLSTT